MPTGVYKRKGKFRGNWKGGISKNRKKYHKEYYWNKYKKESNKRSKRYYKINKKKVLDRIYKARALKYKKGDKVPFYLKKYL